MRSICLFCGSSVGNDPIYSQAARQCAQTLAAAGIKLIYGGGSVGLMGILADSALAAGGEVVGVIPRTLWEREVGHRGLAQLHIVETMHERKALMSDLSDAYLALPGGIGTLDEFFEIWTWGTLGMHTKPCGLLNIGGYFDPLLAFLRNAVDNGFLRCDYHDMMLVDDNMERMLERFAAFRAPVVPKWLDRRTI